MMHYNFVESQGDPATDPIILWQQGGPGSSGFGYVLTRSCQFFLILCSHTANVNIAAGTATKLRQVRLHD